MCREGAVMMNINKHRVQEEGGKDPEATEASTGTGWVHENPRVLCRGAWPLS